MLPLHHSRLLPRLESNQDQEIQSLPRYHYTTGQLPDEGSNLDYDVQSVACYHYTIGH